MTWLTAGTLPRDGAGTGRGVRIAIIDSGVHASHPHVAGPAIEGVGIEADGTRGPDFVDRLGHGTAVAAAIREKAPDAALLVARVFDRELTTTAMALVAAIDWAVEQRVHLINLSLGTSNPSHAEALGSAVARAHAAGTLVVAAGTNNDVAWLPGSLPGAVAVVLDWRQPRERCVVERIPIADGLLADIPDGVSDAVLVHASGYPRPIPGVPPERNLKGLSFAVANATGLLAQALALDEESSAS